MTKRKNPETSVEAFRSLTADQLTDTYKAILSALDVIGEGTFEEISITAKMDKARVWKRLSELHKMELIYRPGNKRMLKSGRLGYTWMKTTESLKKVEVEKSLPGKTVSEYSKDLIKKQPTLF